MIFFEKMTLETFNKYLKRLKNGYTKEIARAHNIDLTKAAKKAEEDIDGHLTDGYDTPNNFFCVLKKEKTLESVGTIWYIHMQDNNVTFLADIEIGVDYRDKGFGTESLSLLEKKTKKAGLKAIVLHVFKHNQKARKLYEHLGYEILQDTETGINMIKRL